MNAAPIHAIKTRATEVAQDLITENNDAPLSVRDLLVLCYIRAFTDGVKYSADTVSVKLQKVQS